MGFIKPGEYYSGNKGACEIVGWSRPFRDFGGQHHHEPFRMCSGDGMKIYSYIDAYGKYQEGHPKNDTDWSHWDNEFVAKVKARKTKRPQMVSGTTTSPRGVSCNITVCIALPKPERLYFPRLESIEYRQTVS